MKVHIQFLGGFAIYVDGQPCEMAFGEKQITLLRILVLQRGKGIPHRRLSAELNMHGDNPHSALKTLISRTRSRLNEVSPSLGSRIVSKDGEYYWEDAPGVTVDVLEIAGLLDQLHQKPAAGEVARLTERLIDLYKGELEGEYWLHRKYLAAVYQYIELMRSENAYDKILEICRRAMAVDGLDEHLGILYMDALIHVNQLDEALLEYKKRVRQSRQYFCAEPSDELKSCYAVLASLMRLPPLAGLSGGCAWSQQHRS